MDTVALLVELDYLRKENQRLREALKPFAEWSSEITNADIERAKQVLNRE